MRIPGQSRLKRQEDALLGASGLIERSRSWSPSVYIGTIVSLAGLTLLLGLAAFALTPSSGSTAIWWPAAGTAAILYLLYRGPRWQAVVLVAVLAGLSNLIVGRPLSFALGGTIVTGVEIAVFGALLGAQARVAMLASTRKLLRFVAAALAAAVSVGVLGGIMFLLLVNANPIDTFATLVPSHVSALLLIAPLALVPLPRQTTPQGWELALQIASSAAAAAVIFLTPQSGSLSTLALPFLGWAAVRFRPIVAIAQVLALSVVTTVAAVLGSGPFVSPGTAPPIATLVQIYLLSIAATMLFLIASRSERAELRAQNERSEALLRGGFIGSRVGSLFVRTDDLDGPDIIEINEVAENLVRGQWFENLISEWVSSGSEDISSEITLDNGHIVQVFGRRVPTEYGESILAVQLVDVTDLVRARESLEKTVTLERQMVDELRKISSQKDDFVAAVSHELRTPITSIVGFSEELDESANEEQREYTTIIRRNARRLTEMVEELLELGRMTAPNPVRDRSDIDVEPVIREVIDDQTMSARARGVTITYAPSLATSMVSGDVNALSRIVTNLLSNAIKFTPEGGVVEVRTEIHDEGASLTLFVDDSGPGISDADSLHVFDRFFRSESAEKRLTPGTGLGLSIVRSLAQLLGGTVEIGRSARGGARIAVTLPRVQETQAV
ncbi:ATP-binding protein [Yonghaparkia sp. Root332]|uniref:ATP-binding protein n=1 Tax=Yonghaparkia sp. Root332 TaxID=1736516 RepID=UPI000700D3F8|nr:ATP-binding protein [Yonghaparkia sp. Root332]KQV25855.1 hypothetical protein ASC54_02445 [Yonghaparkia sp. Root332]